MIKKLTVGIIAALILSLAAFGVQAQDKLTVGKAADGELTDANFAIEYTYAGKADEVIVITLKPDADSSELNTPAIIVRDSSGTDLVRYDGYGSTTIVTTLPKDGDYTIVATRTDDKAGTSVGKFTLEVSDPTELAIGDSIDMTVNSEETNYFVYRGDADFVLSYERQGDYAPEFTVNTLDSDVTPGTLNTLATVGGKLATQGSVGVIPGKTVYVVKVAQALFDFYFDKSEATYTLKISEATK